MSRVRSKSRVTSSRRNRASAAWRRADDDRLLATTLTPTNTNSATQFWGSAIVRVPTGGRKKKFKQTVVATARTIATRSDDSVAAASTIIRYVSTTMAEFEIPAAR